MKLSKSSHTSWVSLNTALLQLTMISSGVSSLSCRTEPGTRVNGKPCVTVRIRKTEIREGMGVQVWSDGSKYEGFWRDNKANGRG